MVFGTNNEKLLQYIEDNISIRSQNLCESNCNYLNKMVRQCGLFYNNPLKSVDTDHIYRCDECKECFMEWIQHEGEK